MSAPPLRCITLILLIICNFSTEPALGQNKEAHDRLLEFFSGACLQAMPNIDRVKAGARAMNWKPLEGDIATMLAPADETAVWQGWAAKTDSDLFLLGVSEGKSNGRQIATCSVVVREIDQENLVKGLGENLKLKYLADDTEAFQRYRAWTTEVSGNKMLINLTTLSKEPNSPATLSVMVEE